MTKKHFEAIAATYAEVLGSSAVQASSLARTAVLRTLMGVVEVCAETNPRFDKTRFLRACGVKGSQQSQRLEEVAL